MKITFVLLIMINTCLLGQSIKPHTIGIVVSDIEKSTKWFENILEVKLYKQMNFPEYDSLKINFLKGDYFQIELMEKNSSFAITKYVADYSLNKAPLVGFSKVAFSVPDINSTYERIKKLNVTEILGLTKDKEFNSEYFIIKDLDGNVLQFIQQKHKIGGGEKNRTNGRKERKSEPADNPQQVDSISVGRQ